MKAENRLTRALMDADKIAVLAAVVVLITALITFTRWFVSPLRKIPGPRIAILTDIWRLCNALSGKEELINLDLHEQYGKPV